MVQHVSLSEELLSSRSIKYRPRIRFAWESKGDSSREIRLNVSFDNLNARSLRSCNNMDSSCSSFLSDESKSVFCEFSAGSGAFFSEFVNVYLLGLVH